MKRLQTLVQAAHLATTAKSRDLARARTVLNGLPIGGWPQTRQAINELMGYLPYRRERAYTMGQFIEANYRVSTADRYETRDIEATQLEAARIEGRLA